MPITLQRILVDTLNVEPRMYLRNIGECPFRSQPGPFCSWNICTWSPSANPGQDDDRRHKVEAPLVRLEALKRRNHRPEIGELSVKSQQIGPTFGSGLQISHPPCTLWLASPHCLRVPRSDPRCIMYSVCEWPGSCHLCGPRT